MVNTNVHSYEQITTTVALPLGLRFSRTISNTPVPQVIEAVDGPLPAGLPSNTNLSAELSAWLRGSLVEICESTRQRLAGITLDRLLHAGINGNRANHALFTQPSVAMASAGESLAH